jgi:hypothetical protein
MPNNSFKVAIRLLETGPMTLCHGVLANNSGSPEIGPILNFTIGLFLVKFFNAV